MHNYIWSESKQQWMEYLIWNGLFKTVLRQYRQQLRYVPLCDYWGRSFRPGGVLVSEGEHVSSSLGHAAFHIRDDKVEPSFGLVQRKLNVHFKHFQIWTAQKTQSTDETPFVWSWRIKPCVSLIANDDKSSCAIQNSSVGFTISLFPQFWGDFDDQLPMSCIRIHSTHCCGVSTGEMVEVPPTHTTKQENPMIPVWVSIFL